MPNSLFWAFFWKQQVEKTATPDGFPARLTSQNKSTQSKKVRKLVGSQRNRKRKEKEKEVRREKRETQKESKKERKKERKKE